MKLEIEVIPHNRQRYDTVGDWFLTGEGIKITVSKLDNFYEEMCVAFHEMAEVLLCLKRGISQYDVDKFDMEFEKNRKPGDFTEPGNDPTAPYHKEHCFASTVEQMLAAEFGIDWRTYEEKINSLEWFVTNSNNDHAE